MTLLFNSKGEPLPSVLYSRELGASFGMHGQGRGFLWHTDAGTFTTKTLAERFEISTSKVKTTYRRAGFDPIALLTPYHKSAEEKEEETKAGNRGNWGGLKGKDRSYNLDKITEGSWEKDNL